MLLQSSATIITSEGQDYHQVLVGNILKGVPFIMMSMSCSIQLVWFLLFYAIMINQGCLCKWIMEM